MDAAGPHNTYRVRIFLPPGVVVRCTHYIRRKFKAFLTAWDPAHALRELPANIYCKPYKILACSVAFNQSWAPEAMKQ
jgi:hypothetical protein